MNKIDHYQRGFVKSRVLNAIVKSEKIVVVGPPNDYYKIYFFSDAYRYYKVELKGPGRNVPKRFSDGGKAVLKRDGQDHTWHLVDKATAYTMLCNCSYEPTQANPHVLKPDSEVMEWIKQILTSKVTA
ncbi:hypothetical protein GCM10027341_09670 [Spirosoma knui]